MAKLEDILKTTLQREDLDELCNIIFGSDFEEMMKTRYMSYDELDKQRRELQDSVGGSYLLKWRRLRRNLPRL